MNAYYNPVFLLRLMASYLSDVNRIWHYNDEQIRRYQDKSFRKIVRYAYTVPLYHNKYKEHGIHPNDIRGIKDIQKLPLIAKEDLRNNFPNNITPKGFNINNSYLVGTSGSTGKPVKMYYDLIHTVKHVECFIRALKAIGENWQKTKIVQIIDLAPGAPDVILFQEGIRSFINKFISTDNQKNFPVSEDPEILLKKLDKIQPEIISSDPTILRNLATLKINGHGKNVNPKFLTSSGANLDEYSKKYIEKAFNSRVLNYYATTEAGLISFECLEGSYHINSDFVFLEVLDEKNKPVGSEEPGRAVISKLYGGGTPIIRYTGLDDIVVLTDKKCSCSINSPIITEIQGRSMDMITLPDGKTIAPFSLTTIPAKIMKENNTHKIKQFQIIQHKVDEIEVLIVIDKKMRKDGISVNKLLNEIKNNFSEKVGQGVIITVNEVDEIQKNVRSDYIKVVISKVKLKAD